MLKAVGKVVLLVFLVLLAVYAIARLKDRSAVRQLEAKVRKQGDPLTINELAARYSTVPDEENGAIPLLDLWEKDDPQYWQAFRRGERPAALQVAAKYDPDLPFLGTRRVKPGQQLSEASQRALEPYLATNSNHIRSIRDSLKPLRYRFPIRFEQTYDALLPHLRKLQTEAQNLRLEGLRTAQAADVPGTLAVIRDILLVSDTMAEEPILISQIIRLSCVAMALNVSEDLLSRHALSVEQIRELQNLFDRLQPRKMLRFAIAAERVASLSVFTHNSSAFTSATDSEMPTSTQFKRLRRIFSLTGLAIADRRLMLEVTQQAIDIADDTSDQALQRLKGLEMRAARTKGVPPRIFSSMMMPAIATATGRFLNLEARLTAAKVALAIERCRVERGELPQSLGELVPKYLPKPVVDPFDLQPFRYLRFATGYVVYSIGADFNDDGGKPKIISGAPEDETFTVNR